MRGYFPCALCRAYVLTATGCRHYRPNAKEASRRRARQRQIEQAVRERARQDVARFRATMRIET